MELNYAVIPVRPAGGAIFDFGEWGSEVTTRKEQDGTTTFVIITPGIFFQAFIVGSGETRTLIVRDAQHEYCSRPRPAKREEGRGEGSRRQCRLKYCTARSCRKAASRVRNVPRLRRFPVFGFGFRE